LDEFDADYTIPKDERSMRSQKYILSRIRGVKVQRLVPAILVRDPDHLITRSARGLKLLVGDMLNTVRFPRQWRVMKSVGLVSLLLLCSYTNAGEDESEVDPDPWRGMNQVTHRFNEHADRLLLKPVAKGYMAIIPGPIRRCISNFFGNLRDVETGVNNLLQGKPGESASDFLRIITNTTIGLGGLFDPASRFGLVKHTEDFGQTLTVWGLPTGPYLVLPFFGPNTLTDALTNPLNPRLDPVRYLYPVDHRNVLFGLRAIDNRAYLLSAETIVTGDRYVFIREAYLQRRNYLVLDGEVEDEFDDF
jgi:phospholipid-binding lipoprotein MlaA